MADQQIMVANSTTYATTTYSYNVSDVPTFKIVLIGEPEVGKSSVFLRYAKNRFEHRYRPTRTAAIENVVKKVNLPTNLVTSVTLWDLPGRDEVDMRDTYYRNADAAIVVVNMDDNESIELAGSWKQDFHNHATVSRVMQEQRNNGATFQTVEENLINTKSIPVLLLGNKYDLIDKEVQRLAMKDFLEEAAMEATNNNNEEEDLNSESETESNLKPQTPIRNRRKPACVELLEDIEEEYGFVASVMVSAKDGDTSVSGAIQNLVRHLLQKERPKKMRKEIIAEDTTVTTKEEKKHDWYLQDTGIKELDILFIKCHLPLRKTRDYIQYYELSLKQFKQTCADLGMLTESKASLEDCITGLKLTLREDSGLKIQAEDDDDGFVRLIVDGADGVKLQQNLVMALNAFHTEYAALCKAILQHCPTLEVILQKLDQKVEEKAEKLQTENQINQKRLIKICDRNRGRLEVARQQLRDLINLVEQAKTKVYAALMW